MKAIKSYRRYLRAGLVLLEVLAIIACLIAGLTGLAFWRLSRGPVDIDFARPMIENALTDNGKSVSIQRLMLHWPRINRPLSLYMRDVTILEKGAPVLDINSLSISLSGPYLFIGRIVPVSVTFREPALYLIRTSDNKIMLRFQEESEQAKIQAEQAAQDASVATVESAAIPDEDSKIIIDELIHALSMPEGSKNSDIGLLRHIDSVLVENARALVEDHVAGTTWRMTDMNLSFLRDADELLIEANATVPGADSTNSSVDASAVYKIGKGMSANLTVTNLDPAIVTGKISGLQGVLIEGVRVSGQANLVLDDKLHPLRANMDFAASSGIFNYNNMYDPPLSLEEMKIKAAYDGATGEVSLDDFVVIARKVNIQASGKGILKDGKFLIPLNVNVPLMAQEQIKNLWPSSLAGTQAESWLVNRMSGGVVKNASLKVDLSAEKTEAGWVADAGNIHASFEVADMDIDYEAPLQKAENVSGKGSFDDHILNVQIEKGMISDLEVTGGSINIDHIGHDDQVSNADIKVRLKGPVSSVFRYIESKPIEIKAQDIGLKIDAVQGAADLEAHISFPAVKDLLKDDVIVKVNGSVSQVALPDVLSTLDLGGGPYKITVADGLVSLEGTGTLEGRAIDLKWEQFISLKGKPYSSKINAKIAADNDLRKAIGVGLEEWIDGAPQVDVTYTEFQDGRAEADIKADVTAAKMMVAPFDYIKQQGVKASVSCLALLKGKKLQEIKNLQAQGADISFDKANFTFINPGVDPVLQTGNIPRLRLGNTDAKIILTRLAGNILKVDVSGASLDAQPFLKRKEQQQNNTDKTAVQATVMVDRMKTSALQDLNKVRTYLEIDADGRARRVEVDATAGQGALTVRLLPNEKGVNTFYLESDDAGATLRAFDVFKEMRGGKIIAKGEAPDAKSSFTINGQAEITNFKVVGAPALARLVSILSLSGMGELLSGEGMSFARLRTDFMWAIRKAGDIYTFRNGGTSGSSLGISFEGNVNKETNKVDMKGEIVPASEVNNLISNIPIIGDILSGGGAMFAATYTITGPLEKQEVSVNPLSVLTPGIIRKMLFE